MVNYNSLLWECIFTILNSPDHPYPGPKKAGSAKYIYYLENCNKLSRGFEKIDNEYSLLSKNRLNMSLIKKEASW